MVSADVFRVVTDTERQWAPFLHNSKTFSVPHLVTKMKNLLLFKCKFGSNCIDENFLVPYCSMPVNNIFVFYFKINMFTFSKYFSDTNYIS